MILEAAAAAAERRIANRLDPEFEDDTLGALQALRNLHGPLILAAAEGRELQEQADRLQMTREQQAKLRTVSNELAQELQSHGEIIEPNAAAMVIEAVETIGAEPHPERGTTFGIAAVKNAAIILLCGALAAVPSFYVGGLSGIGASMGVWEVLKKAPVFASAAESLGKLLPKTTFRLDTAIEASVAIHLAEVKIMIERLTPFRSFIISNQNALREIAGATSQLRWMLTYIDYVVRTAI